ncbi:MAG: tetratricopeptide repeat protein, partial [Magnetococcales bacterium]|nr:tetratricopeptide repeat protein [Magnetococcales bacterium]
MNIPLAAPGRKPGLRPLLSPSLAVLSLLVALGCAYWNVTLGAFHFDDESNIIDNRALQVHTPTLASLWQAGKSGYTASRPLAGATFAWDWHRGGGRAGAFLATNRVIHGVNALLLLALLYRLIQTPNPQRRLFAAWVGALFWTVHPIQVQAVAYATQRMASLATLCMLLSVLAFMQWRVMRGRAWLWLPLSAASCGVGMLVKEIAALVPLLLLLVEFGARPETVHRRPWDPLWLALPVGGMLCFVLDGILGGPLWSFLLENYQRMGERVVDFSMGERLLTQPRVFFFHLSQILWPLPERFAIEHDFVTSRAWLQPPATLLAWLALGVWCVVGGWLLVAGGPRRVLGSLLLWPVAALSLESGPVGLEMVYEHRMYLPLAGFAGLLSWGVAHGWRPGGRGWALTAGLLVCVGLLILSTRTRLLDWRSPMRLLQATVVHTAPNSARAWDNLGTLYAESQRVQEAEAAFSMAIALNPRHVAALVNRGILRSGSPHTLESALADLNSALDRPAPPLQALVARGNLLVRLGRLQEAERDYARALRVGSQGDDVGTRDKRRHLLSAAHYQMGNLQQRLQRFPLALDHYRQAVAIDPGNALATFNQGELLLRLGRGEEALQALNRAVALQPADPSAYFLRGKARL